MAFHDVIHTVTMPERVGEVHTLLEGALWTYAIRVHQEKHNCGTGMGVVGASSSGRGRDGHRVAGFRGIAHPSAEHQGPWDSAGAPRFFPSPFGQVDGPDLVGQDSIC